MERRIRRIRACYARLLERGKFDQGGMLVEFLITPDGLVEGARAAWSTIDEPSMHRCVLKRFSKLEFRPPGGDRRVVVTYPLVFTSIMGELAPKAIEAAVRRDIVRLYPCLLEEQVAEGIYRMTWIAGGSDTDLVLADAPIRACATRMIRYLRLPGAGLVEVTVQVANHRVRIQDISLAARPGGQ